MARNVGDDLWTASIATAAPVGNSGTLAPASPSGLLPCAILGTTVEQPHPR